MLLDRRVVMKNKDKVECTCCLVLFFLVVILVGVLGNFLVTCVVVVFLLVTFEVAAYKKGAEWVVDVIDKVFKGKK